MRTDRDTLAQGAIAGVIGATALALWYLLLDLIDGAPLHTPGFLARVFLGQGPGEVTAGALLYITLIHYAVFLALGVVTALILEAWPRARPLLLGSVVGFFLFDLVFYGTVIFTGGRVAEEIGWPAILVGNVVAGLALGATLGLMGIRERTSWWIALKEHRPLREGLEAGLIGAAVVALWFLLVDSLRGQPFLTPAALGSAVFLGARTMAAISIRAGTVIGYTLLHLAAFCLLGVGVSLLLDRARKTPHLVVAFLLFFIVAEAVFMGYVAIVAEFLLGAMAWWAIAVGNGLAAFSMGYFLTKRHPEIKDVISGKALGW